MTSRGAGRIALILILIAAAAASLAGVWIKLTCTVPYLPGCYSDLTILWDTRNIGSHVFPYLSGGMDANGIPSGGSYEYPVLTGLLIWLTSLPATTATGFLQVNAVVSVVLAVAVAALLHRTCGLRSAWWALSPALVLYPLHNWDLPAVICAVAGFAIVLAGPWSFRRRVLLAAVVFGIGFAFKLYPGFFLAPLCLYALVGERAATDSGADAGADSDGETGGERPALGERLRTAVLAGVAGVATAVLVNAPFALFGYDGWWASILFQRLRQADSTTNSLWYWGVRPAYEDPQAYTAMVDRWSPLLILLGFALVLLLGLARAARAAVDYPWVQVSAAMLVVFLLFHKVDSPQYALWLVPFFVLLRVHPVPILAYLIANCAVGIGWFLAWYEQPNGTGLLLFGVWGQVIALAALLPVLLAARPAAEPRLGRVP